MLRAAPAIYHLVTGQSRGVIIPEGQSVVWAAVASGGMTETGMSLILLF